jgi:hypothetical protein
MSGIEVKRRTLQVEALGHYQRQFTFHRLECLDLHGVLLCRALRCREKSGEIDLVWMPPAQDGR